jgi:hypothetical protein
MFSFKTSISNEQILLNQLKDIHLPPALHSYSIALGGWLVLILLFIILSIVIFIRTKRKKRRTILKIAYFELSLLAKKNVSTNTLIELSRLLKRVCLIYYPTYYVASLKNEEWWTFLNLHIPKNPYTDKEIQFFLQFRYQKKPQLTAIHWKTLIDKTHNCLNCIIWHPISLVNKSTQTTFQK